MSLEKETNQKFILNCNFSILRLEWKRTATNVWSNRVTTFCAPASSITTASRTLKIKSSRFFKVGRKRNLTFI